MRTVPGLVLLAFASAAMLVGAQLPHYAEIVSMPPQVTAWIAAFATLLTLGLIVMAVGVALGVLGSAVRVPRLGLALGTGWVLGSALYGWCDLISHQLTRNHLVFYLPFLLERDVTRWGGSPRDLASVIGVSGARMLALALLALAGAMAFARAAERRQVSLRTALIPWVAGGIIGSLLTVGSPWPTMTVRLVEAQPLPSPLPTSNPPAEVALVAHQAHELYARQQALNLRPQQPNVGTVAPGTERPRDVVIIALDSLRADVLTSDYMPRLTAWSQRGTRFLNHYANANTTVYGFFTMVRGRYALGANVVWAAQRKAPFARTAMFLGYRPHMYLSCDPNWGEMRASAGAIDWTFHDYQAGEAWERDRDSIAAARQDLATATNPHLSFVFLMSSHFGYSSPPGALPKDLPAPISFRGKPMPASYRAALWYLDGLIADWIETLDPTTTLVMLTGDHGESFGEDGAQLHGSAISAVQTHVPFVVVGPGVPAHGQAAGITEHVDIAPTVLSMLGMPKSELAWFHGQSLFDPERASRSFAGIVPKQDWGLASQKMGFLSPERGFLFRMGVKETTVEFEGVVLPTGGFDSAPLTQSTAETFLQWFESFLGRVQHVDPPLIWDVPPPSSTPPSS